MRSDTNTQVWAGMAATFLGVGSALVVATTTTEHPRGYHWYGDALFWVGIGLIFPGVWAFLKLFVFPRLWLPSVKGTQPLSGQAFIHRQGLSDGGDPVVVIRILIHNREREDVTGAIVSMSLPSEVKAIDAANSAGAVVPTDQQLEREVKPGRSSWVLPNRLLFGMRGNNVYVRLVLPPEASTYEFLFHITSSDLYRPFDGGFFLVVSEGLEVAFRSPSN